MCENVNKILGNIRRSVYNFIYQGMKKDSVHYTSVHINQFENI